MYSRPRLQASRRAKAGLAVVLLAAAAFITLPNMTNASATAGNMSAACAGTDGVAQGKLKAFESFKAYVNGNEIPTDRRKIDEYVKPGDTLKISFLLTPECDGTYVGLAAFSATSANDKTKTQLSQQKLVERKGRSFASDQVYSLSVTAPECYFQIDANTGGPYVPGDYTLDRQGRLLLAAQGGSDSTCAVTTTTEKPTTTTSTSTTSTSTTQAPPVTKAEATTTTTKAPVTTVIVHDTAATAVEACNTAQGSGAKITLTNNGDQAENFKVYVNGTEVEDSPKAVAANSSRLLLWDAAEDSKATIRITANGLDTTRTVTVDCQPPATTAPTTAAPQVLNETVTQPQLAYTGTDVRGWAFAAFMALAVGFALLRKATLIRRAA